jgi:CubicO group peptidase (beta-lactamase class C family)
MRRSSLRGFLITAGLILLWTLVVAAAAVAEAVWFPEPPVVRGDFASIERHLAGQLGGLTDDGRLGSAALVLVHGGEIAAEHGFGVANAETGAPVQPDRTLYQVGSVSKAVTAWGVMKLVEEGRLGLDEPVVGRLERWRFPGSEAYGSKVTARHLLSHTAGVDDGERSRGAEPGERVPTVEEALTPPAGAPWGGGPGVTVVWEPGTAMAYSPVGGYTVLQLLIEEVTDRPFAKYMDEAVLRPLGMTRSSFDLDALEAEGRAHDVATGYDAGLDPAPRRRYATKAAIGLYATPRDLARFAIAFTRENPVLGRETLEGMMMPQPGTGGSWGLGQELYVETGAGEYVVGHSGAAYPALGASVRVNPRTGNGVVLMTSGGRGAANQLVHDWVYWETGTVTDEGRRQVVYDRMKGPIPAAIALGALGIVIWRRRRAAPKGSAPDGR